MGPGNDVVCEQHIQPDEDDNTNDDGVDGVRRVNNNSLKIFWRNFVNHFKILFSRNEIKWPE
jgi:hypothetical protein